jgi:hypothetical protein
MDKEQILEKSRKENEISDERSRLIAMQGANFSSGVLVFLWVVMTKFAPLDMTGTLALGLLTHVTCFSNFLYQFVKSKTKTSIFFTIAFALTTVFYLYQFLSEINILPF